MRSLPMVANRRYTPGYDASLARYMRVLSDHDIGCGVLIQPSFLGYDNSYLLESLDIYSQALRGVVVVPHDISDDALIDMNQRGVVGIRFNMIGKDIAEIGVPDARSLLKRIANLGWHVEIQAPGAAIPTALRHMEHFEGHIVIDHFGLPDPRLGLRDPGFRALLREGETGRTFVKLSAGYRCHGLDVAPLAGALLATLGPRRLLWGSDWPWTQFEKDRSYAQVSADLSRWMPDLAALNQMDQAASGLFRFSDPLHQALHRQRKVA
ncbi:MAG: amidohydrolase family protein [Methylobacterium sp.]|nr:amidohydrolase family protein [Methylobacterium sp.]MCA3638993.1 amidohydrolase family protein [Methylobacterium sp.]MCE2934158.1 amidohydrolase family protein [Hyphomicrobiales bacterium]